MYIPKCPYLSEAVKTLAQTEARKVIFYCMTLCELSGFTAVSMALAVFWY